ncbi:thermonuclease family protein [Dinoroseobacter sp. S76]|uniref:thermonuclease family protein n=1 Tax=Dinoroseobacter sp. S76 TaxID=3415124 RepID=UPI003C7A1FC9
MRDSRAASARDFFLKGLFVELLVLIFVLVTAIAVALRFRGKVDDNTSPPPIDPWETAPKKRASSPRPFDQKTSHSLAKPREISGPARIVDGDTIVIKKTQIRLFGIDAPELDHPYGQKAK